MKHAPREHQRVYLTFYLRIFEEDKFIGFLIDISKDGLMVMSERPLEENREYNLRMKLPPHLNGKVKKLKTGRSILKGTAAGLNMMKLIKSSTQAALPSENSLMKIMRLSTR